MSCLSDSEGLNLFGRSMMRKPSWIFLLLLTVGLWAVEGEKAGHHVPLVTNVVAEQVDFAHVLIRYDVEERGIR